MISAQGLQKTYRSGFFYKKGRALRDVSLEVRRGEIYGFIGVNGAGKSTFIKIALGLVHPSKGSMTVIGKPAGDAEVRNRIGYLPEQVQFPPVWTARMFLRTAASIKGMPQPDADTRIGELLGRLNLERHADTEIGAYSKGMQQRLGICHALLTRPELLILDEPMSGLDPLGRREIREVMLQEKKAGATIFFSSHILPDIEAVADHIGFLHKGRLLRESSAAELFVTGLQQGAQMLLPPLDDELTASLGKIAGSLSRQPDGLIELRVDSRQSYEKTLELLKQKRVNPRRVSLMRPTLDEVFAAAISEAER